MNLNSTSSTYVPKYEYTWDEWQNHMEHFSRLGRVPNKSDIQDFFSSIYPHSQEECLWKMIRWLAAYMCLKKHADSFHEFVDSVSDDNGVGITVPLNYALWNYLSAIPDQLLPMETELEPILQIARLCQRCGIPIRRLHWVSTDSCEPALICPSTLVQTPALPESL